ncbi:MAG TPA: MFS transporter [Solirubrobacterales bacterium]|nr:MFS transporter [Solirubrobacterales bacterium]
MAPALTLPLRNSVYRRLFSAQIVGLLGTGISTVALGLLAFSMGGGNAGQILGVVLALKVATYVLVSPAIAAFAAGVSRKKLLVTMDVVRALAIGSIAFVGEIWQVYVLIVIVSAASAGFTPAFQALIPDIFTDVDTYTEALSLSRLAYELEALVSPLIAGLLLAVVGYTELFTLNSLAFLTSAGLVLTTAVPAVRDDALAARKLSQVSQGIRQFLRTPRLQGLFLLDWALRPPAPWSSSTR